MTLAVYPYGCGAHRLDSGLRPSPCRSPHTLDIGLYRVSEAITQRYHRILKKINH